MTSAPHWVLLKGFVRAFALSAGVRGAFGFAAALAGAAAESAGLLLLVPVLRVLTGGAGAAVGWFRGWGADALLATLLGGFAVAMIVRAAILYARDMILWRVEADFVDDERRRLMARLACAQWSAMAPMRHAEVQTILSTEILRLATATRMFVQIGVAALMVAAQAALALILAPGLATIVLVLVLGLLAAFAGLARSDALGRDMVRANAVMMHGVGNLLSGLKAALAQNLQHRFVREFDAAQAQLRASRHGFAERQARTRALFGLGSALAAVLLVVGGIWFRVETPVLILLVLIFARLSGPLTALQQSLQQFAYALPSYAAVTQMEAQLGAASASPDTGGREWRAPTVELRAVRAKHGAHGGVEDVSLTIAPGACIAITGASGSGKTTMLDVMAGLMPVESGTVAVDGVPLDAAGLAAWRDRIAYVVQDPFLFHDSVRANLIEGADSDDAAIWQALETVGVADRVRRMDAGLDTIVGERGALLSGGERQRLALARALLRRPLLLMFDEATNAIDLPSERQLLDRIAAMTPRPALVMVTHRRDNLERFDQRFEMRDGRLHPAA